MKHLTLLAALFIGVVAARAETMQQWVNAAPPSEVGFTPWQSSTNTYGEGLRLAQGVYGYVDLSKIPASEFPIRARLLYTPAQPNRPDNEVAFNSTHSYGMPAADAMALPPRYVDETTINSPNEATALPVWNSPFIFNRSPAVQFESQMESVRLEVLGESGTVLARQLIGSSAWNQMLQRAVVVNAPELAGAFHDAGIEAIAVPGLVPDDFALINVETVWIDSTALQDPALTDAYWRRVLLGGTTVAGHPEDIAALATRLAINPSETVLNGRLVSCSTPDDLRAAVKWKQERGNGPVLATDDNPFYFSSAVGHDMNLELISFSRWYLGIFLVLQAGLIFFAFTQLRGQRRVWLWLVVPLFAILYSIAGTVLASLFVHHRAEAAIDQIERQREGWPEAQVITEFSHINIGGGGTSVHFPLDSRPTYLATDTRLPDPGADLIFRREASDAQLLTSPSPGRKMQTFVRSWIPARAPILATPDGKITPQRAFSGAWLWNGTNWVDLGTLQAGKPVAIDAADNVQPGTWNIGPNRVWQTYYDERTDFPGFLKPLLLPSATSALTDLQESIFFGVEAASDYTFDQASSYLVKSRRVVAYQFHLPKAQP
jgi:hypothetical protein